MKPLIALCFSAFVSLAQAAEPTVVKGVVQETMNSGGYTYMRLKTPDGETWAAVNRAQVSKGAEVVIEKPMVMEGFESPTLKRTFPRIVFGSLAAPSARPALDMVSAHAGVARAKPEMEVKTAKASGLNARTVAEVNLKAAELKDKPVQVRGRVVKVNNGILGKNWVHLRDGSGSAADGSNDLLVTTTAQAKVGDEVTASGPVRLNKDFGAGYVYKVLVEDAALQP
jgi:hypothetical protein